MIEGHCPQLLQNLLEVRGLGLLDIRTIFGETSVRRKMRLKLIVHLVRATAQDKFERLPLQDITQDMLGLPIRKVMLQVAAGRNLAVLVEAAVRNTILKLRGIDTLGEFMERQAMAILQSSSNATVPVLLRGLAPTPNPALPPRSALPRAFHVQRRDRAGLVAPAVAHVRNQHGDVVVRQRLRERRHAMRARVGRGRWREAAIEHHAYHVGRFGRDDAGVAGQRGPGGKLPLPSAWWHCAQCWPYSLPPSSITVADGAPRLAGGDAAAGKDLR